MFLVIYRYTTLKKIKMKKIILNTSILLFLTSISFKKKDDMLKFLIFLFYSIGIFKFKTFKKSTIGSYKITVKTDVHISMYRKLRCTKKKSYYSKLALIKEQRAVLINLVFVICS